jgi:hypothetical protein
MLIKPLNNYPMKYLVTYKLYSPKGALRVAACQIIVGDALNYFLGEYGILSQNKEKDSLQVIKIGQA